MGSSSTLTHEDIEDLLVELISGKLLFETNGGILASRYPTVQEQNVGRVVFAKAMREAREAGILTRDQLEQMALEKGQIDADSRQQVAQLNSQLVRLNKARENTTDPIQKIEFDHSIQDITKRLGRIAMAEWEVLQHAAEVVAESQRSLYFTSTCTLTGDFLDRPMWDSWDSFQQCTDEELINSAREAQVRLSAGMPITVIRAIARSSQWRSRWKAAKESGSPLFEGEASSWDKNKLALSYWSEFYDTILRHPECPPEEVIANDEQLQNWINDQAQKQKQAQLNRPSQGPTVRSSGGRQWVRSGEVTKQVGQPYRVRT